MKTCKFCQAELNDEDLLCPKCGKTQAEEPAEAAEETVNTPAEAEAAPEAAPAEAAAEAAEETAETAPETVTAPEAETTEEKPASKATPGKIALAVAAVVVLLAALIALVVTGVKGGKEAPAETDPTETASATLETAETEETVPPTVPADGEQGTITEKGTYTVSDEEAVAARDTVVATMGDIQLTNADLQTYYWMEVHGFLMQYYTYASYFGLDLAQSLDTQLSLEQNITWQQYFLQAALMNWQQVQAMSAEAKKAELPISEEDQKALDELKATLEANAESYGITLEELLKSNMGPAAGYEEYERYQRDFRQGVPYYTAEQEKLQPTEEELEAFFTEHEGEYLEQGITKDARLVDVRHILLQPEGGTTGEDGQTTYSDEEWEACRAAAQEILDGWLAGEKTEDAFAALANEHSTDPGSNTNGGLYEDVYQGQMVPAFDEWCFDESRAYGDSGLVQTNYGYHIMFFVDGRPMWKQYTESDWKTEKTNAMLEELLAKYPMTVDYGKICLGDVPMGG